MLAIYTFVFSSVFKAKWNVPGIDGTVEFALVLWIGLMIHGLFADAVARAPNLVVAHANYVKKVIFPIEILPVVGLSTALFNAGINAAVLIAGLLVTGQSLHLNLMQLPLLIVPLALITLGLMWVLAATGVFLREIGHTIGLVVTVLLFLSPVFYPITAVPEEFRVFMTLNPLTFYIEQARAIIITGASIDLVTWTIHLLAGIACAWSGFWFFQRVRKGFADVI
jgi:lipopolysaccharide transport system permease protein